MHSQAVDMTITKMVLEPEARLLLGAAISNSNASECVSVHSLDADVGLLAARYKFAPPPDKARSPSRMMQQVCTCGVVWCAGRVFGCLAASNGGVWGLRSQPWTHSQPCK
jgi:hypothetical protein